MGRQVKIKMEQAEDPNRKQEERLKNSSNG
jgi:hypothetical protein